MVEQMDENLRQQIIVEEHLKLLRIGYFVSSGMSAFVSLFGLFYGFIGFGRPTVSQLFDGRSSGASRIP